MLFIRFQELRIKYGCKNVIIKSILKGDIRQYEGCLRQSILVMDLT